MSDTQKPLEYAKIAYAAYGAETDYKNYQGLPMPTWDELPDKIKLAWIAAATAVYQAYEQDRPC
jgi:hypothetical protein